MSGECRLFGNARARSSSRGSPESGDNDAVKVGMGFVSTMAALVLGLLVASTKGAYDPKKSEVTQMAAKIVFLDRAFGNVRF